MSPSFESLFQRHIALSWEKQMALQQWAADLDWGFDMDAGELELSDGTTWNVQILGTESEASQTWLWAWANAAVDIPEELLVFAHQVEAYGKQHDIPEFVESKVDVTVCPSSQLALIASGLCHAQAFYRCPYDGGAMYALFTDRHFPPDIRELPHRIASTFTDLIMQIEVSNHKAAFDFYVQSHQLHRVMVGNTLRVSKAGNEILVAQFDNNNRLVHIETL